MPTQSITNKLVANIKQAQPSNLNNFVNVINHMAKTLKVVFPIHPRTKNNIETHKILYNNS